MKHSLENPIYVQRDNFVYEVKYFDAQDTNYLIWHLELVAGVDYINADISDIRGYVPASRFVEDKQSDTVIQYHVEESLKAALEGNDYIVLTNLPSMLKGILSTREHN